MKYRKLRPKDKIRLGDFVIHKTCKAAKEKSPITIANKNILGGCSYYGWVKITNPQASTLGTQLKQLGFCGFRPIK